MKIRFVRFWGHPATKLCARKLKAEDVHIKAPIGVKFGSFWGIINSFLKAPLAKKEKCTYLCESLPSITFPLLMRWIKGEENYIIIRANDLSFNMDDKSKLMQIFYNFFHSRLDGVIAVSSLVAEDARKHVNCPVEISHTFLWRGIKAFRDASPNFKDRNFVFVGGRWYREYKGIDILARTFKLLKEGFPSSRLYLVGGGIEQYLRKLRLDDPSFVYTGYTDPIDYFKKSLFYLHLARYEPSPAALTEAMASGLIPFVTSKVGNKDLVVQVDPNLVIDSQDPEVIATKIKEYLSTVSVEDLKRMSKRCREIASRYDIEHGTESFKRAFYNILEKIKR